MWKNRKGQFFPYSDTAPRKKFPLLTITLIILNTSIFFWSLTDFENIISTFGFTPAYFSILTIFTSMFLHGGLDHLFGNMWYLWIFGDNVEDYFGKFKFLVFYLLSGVVAAFFQFFTDPTSRIPSVGASGAISGVLGAYLILFPKEKILTNVQYFFIRIPAYIVIGFWFLIQFFFGTITLLGITGSNIGFWAHIGGFLFGLLFTKLFSKKKRRRSKFKFWV
ncbi:MAG: rhomboid family intramembrane serine protease [Candidatus Aenigmatarchaeota archaeon]